MSRQVRKFSRIAAYAFFLVLTAFVSALLGGKKSEKGSTDSLISDLGTPTAHADIAVPLDISDTGQGGSSAADADGSGSACNDNDSGDCSDA